MFVLDTDVISRTSPVSTRSADVGPWLTENEPDSFLSAVTLSELYSGAARLTLRGADRKSSILSNWIGEVEASMNGRWIPVDREVARRAGHLLARAEASGHKSSYTDACIAATAAVHGFIVITFNLRHFAAFDVPHRFPATSP